MLRGGINYPYLQRTNREMSSTFTKYGLEWDREQFYDDALIERYMIQQGGQWQVEDCTVGEGLIYHFKAYWSLLWPEDSQTWWTDLVLKEVLANQFTSIVGPASSWKSGTIARLALMDWSTYPDITTIIMSSTDMEGLRSRIFGETTKMWKVAHEGYEWFPGCPIDYKCVIAADDIDDTVARDIRNGIIGVPCKTSTGRFIGMGKYAGRKNWRVWCIGDEFQFMQRSILDAQDNLISNGPNLLPGINRNPESIEYGKPLRGYKCVFIGNTNPTQPDNPLHIVSEPDGGWGSMADDGKTKVWKCKKLMDHPVQCVCVNFDALDSPNTPYPIDAPRYENLAGPHKVAVYTEGSESYYSQGRGVFKFGLAAFKIITKEVCQQFHAFDGVTWKGSQITNIGMLDAAYGAVGGDRCALGWLQFGLCIDDVIRILLKPHWCVPIVANPLMIPEDQIAMFCKDKMESAGVPPENFFFDGRGSLAMSLARVWSPRVNSIEFGGNPTERPVGLDMYFTARDGIRRIKKANEHYSKFVSELWWSWRYATESDQIRGLSMEIVLDAQPREWRKVAGDKIEIESKRDMKKRTGISPDLADMVVTGIEGARRRGFQIQKLSKQSQGEDQSMNWLADYKKRVENLVKSKMLAPR